MKKTYTACAVAAVAGGAVLTTAGPALAATTVDCTALTNVVYIAGSSASKPLLISLAKKLGSSVSILYAAPASCNGLADVTAQQAETSTFSFVAPDGSFTSCAGAGNTGTFGSVNIDIGVADVFPSSCIAPQVTLGATQKEFRGAIQPMEIVVPYASSESSISADAAYTVFGFAASTYTVMPWNDPTAIFQRGAASGTQLMVSNAIGLSGAKWLSTLTGDAGVGQTIGGSPAMATVIVNANGTKPNQTIGILSAGTADPARGASGTTEAGTQTGMKPLAFQAANQDCGYYPDSDLTHFDKINVRQGRYDIWGPLHFVSNVDAGGKPIATTLSNPVASSSTAVAAFLNAITHTGLTATSTPSLQDVITAETSAHFVPDCAMQVSRTTEDGAEASYQPSGACGCFFESLTGGGTTVSSYCQTCTADADCADAGVFTHCNFGYCEAK